MVFKGSRAALFGGIASIAAPPPQPAPALFNRSWEWDGRHWTARQDMGPGVRVFHGMAFDESRSRVVLFGGSAIATGGEGEAAGLRGDTWEQFEEGASSGTGPGTGTPVIEALGVDPNPAAVGGVVTVQVTLTEAVPTDSAIEILLNGAGVATFEITAGDVSGAVAVQLPGDLTGTVDVTARIGESEVTTQLQIQALATVDVVSIDAQPNPVTGGQTLVITVNVAAPPVEPANVDLLADGQVFANMTISAGATSGELSFPIQAGTPPVQIVLTARSGATEASVQLTIQ